MATALVTGATSGIGHEFAQQLAASGYDMVLVARTTERLDAVAEQLRTANGVEVEVVTADLADRSDTARVAERLADYTRPVDLLVNNAGFGINREFLSSDVEEQTAMMDVMCTAVMILSHAAAGSMASRGTGGIVNVSSIASYTTLGTYAAAKAWATTFSEALNLELADRGVHVMALCPGWVRTEFHERANIEMGGLPDRLWIPTDVLVRQCLADLRRHKVISVPDNRYKALQTVVQYSPRPLVRFLSNKLRDRRDPTSTA